MYVRLYVCTVRMYVCIYVCVYEHMYVYTSIMQICLCICLYVFMYICIYICVYEHMYVYMSIMYICLCICLYVFMYVCGSLFTLILNADGPHYPGYLDTRVGPEALEVEQIDCSCRLMKDTLAARPSIWLLHGLC